MSVLSLVSTNFHSEEELQLSLGNMELTVLTASCLQAAKEKCQQKEKALGIIHLLALVEGTAFLWIRVRNHL